MNKKKRLAQQKEGIISCGREHEIEFHLSLLFSKISCREGGRRREAEKNIETTSN